MESAPLPPDLAALVPRLPTDAARLMAAAYTSLLEERRVLASAESGGTLTPLLARPPTHLHSDAAVAFLARLERRRLKAAAKEDDAPIGWCAA